MDISNSIKSMSDAALHKIFAEYIRHHRLEQNKSQSKLAEEAGINRSTLVEFEKGSRSSTITLIQLLRALDKLDVLAAFKIEEQISPLMLAKMEKQKRQRASKVKEPDNEYKSDW